MSAPANEDLAGRVRDLLLDRPFVPHPLLRSGHFQTIVASRLERRFPWGWKDSRQDFVELVDGRRLRLQCVFQPCPAPTLVAVHGMAGSSHSAYMQAFSHKAFTRGWNSVLLNLYDTRRSPGPPRIFHSGCSQELAQILEILSRWQEIDSMLLVGVSLGGNILLKMLGEWGASPLAAVRAAAVISPLCDLTISWQLFEAPFNFLYRLHFLGGLKRIVKTRADHLSRFVDVNSVMNARNIREFDTAFTVPLGGFDSVFEYYEQASSAPLLGQIRLPTLMIHSRDDPLLPWQPLATPETARNEKLIVHLTKKGGHVGFIESRRFDIDRSWAENRVMDFFCRAL